MDQSRRTEFETPWGRDEQSAVTVGGVVERYKYILSKWRCRIVEASVFPLHFRYILFQKFHFYFRIHAHTYTQPTLYAAMRTSFNTVDVRGLRLRDSEAKVDHFIKAGIPQGRKVIYILHGHGTGQLKEGLREFMKRHPYVSSHRSADETDGGDAFTMVKIKT